ncbi:MAG: ribokinase [Oscillospiraceae bacterium]|nr:ribokinase [Oscillospiraceae bacterium]
MKQRKKIAVIGSINMDLTARTERLPAGGETVPATELLYAPGGKGANQAVAAARLGGDVTMFGCVGEDAFAEKLVENLRQNGVDTTHIRSVPGVSSGIAMITVAEASGENSIVVVPGANRFVTPAYVDDLQDAILQADILLLQNEIPPETVAAVMDLGHRAGKTVLYNPAPAAEMPEGIMEKIQEKIHYLTPNEHEAALLFPHIPALPSLLELYGGKLIVTLGEQGAMAWDSDRGKLLHIPARPAHVVDTTGAGDTFNGAFAYALAEGYAFADALRFANIAAGLSTERPGAQGGMPTKNEVLAAMHAV